MPLSVKQERPDYVHCVALLVGEEDPHYGETWCGRKKLYRYDRLSVEEALIEAEKGGELNYMIGFEDTPTILRMYTEEWLFAGARHALLAGRYGNLAQICPQCSKEMLKALFQGTYQSTPK